MGLKDKLKQLKDTEARNQKRISEFSKEQPRFRLYDTWTGQLLVGEYKSVPDVQTAARKYADERNGEWMPLLFELNEDGDYIRVDRWFY